MMLSDAEYQKNTLDNGRLLHDIEEISKALYLPKTPPEDLFSTSRQQSLSLDNSHHMESISSVFQDDLLYNDKKSSSFWKWKPLKALTHIRHQRFYCCFFLQVLSIEGLPPGFNDLSLCVQWKRKEDVLRTRPTRVCQGRAEFEETLMQRCSVYGSRTGTRNSAKYEPKLFLLNASVVGAPMIDTGKHWVDLTRLLPLTLEELEEKRRTSGKWTTCIKLTGKAKGATMNASFGFSLLKGKSMEPYCFVNIPDNLKLNRQAEAPLGQFDDCGRISTSALHRLDSTSRVSSERSHASSRSMDFRTIDGTSANEGPDLAGSVSFLYKKLEEQNLDNPYEKQQLGPLQEQRGHTSQSTDSGNEYESEMNEPGSKVPLKELFNLEEDCNPTLGTTVIETIEVSEIFKDIEMESDRSEDSESPLKFDDNFTGSTDRNGETHADNGMLSGEIALQELENAINNFLTSEAASISSSLDVRNFVHLESKINRVSSFKEGKLVRSLSLDRLAESVANDFLNMLGTEQCEIDVTFDHVKQSPREHFIEKGSIDLGRSMFSYNTTETQTESTEAAITNFGTVSCSGDFQLSGDLKARQPTRSRRNFKILENLETESLMKQWGLDEDDFLNSPVIASGGFGSPIHATVEAPPDLPSLGEGLGPLVRTRDCGFLRSMNPSLFSNSKNGARLVMQISQSVVLPEVMESDATKTLECWASVGAEKMYSQASELMPLDDITGKTVHQVMCDSVHKSDFLLRPTPSSESVTHHELLCRQEKSSAYLGSGMDHTEIYSDYASPEALVSSTMAKFEILSLEGLKIQSSMSDEGPSSSIRLLPNKNMSSPGTDGVFSCGKASSASELIMLSLSLDEWIKLDTGNNGTFGKNLTIVQRLQFRDPLRDYEMVGSSMLLLIQVERILLSEEDYVTMFNTNPNEEKSDINESSGRAPNFPMFKICGVHVAGLNAEPGDKLAWTSRRQQQSGTRWLLSSGMGKCNKHPTSKWKAITVSSIPMMKKVHSDAILWSISSNFEDAGKKRNTYARNPDIIFPR